MFNEYVEILSLDHTATSAQQMICYRQLSQ